MSEQDVLDRVPGPIILRATVGSTAHGLNVQDATEDLDQMGICVERLRAAMGASAPFEQVVYRTAAEREHKHDARSMAGDLDLTIYSLRKYVRLALKGNPTVLTLLFAPADVSCDGYGAELRGLAPSIVSRQAGKAFLGYLIAQKQRMLGERGQKRVHRPELVEQYGWDVKYGYHAVRLGLQGAELMQTGQVTIPMPEPNRSRVRAIRTGRESEQAVLTWIGELEGELRDLLGTSPLPEEPDTVTVERWMLDTYRAHWLEDRDELSAHR